MQKHRGNYIALSLIVLASIIPIVPLFHSGFFPMHDDTQVARVYEMGKALHDGMIPVRWSKDLGFGYGYPLFTFYAPLAYYIGGLFFLGGFTALLSTKIMMALGIVLSGIFMYLFSKSLWGKVGGVLSALLYLYAPYHALDIYVRGDVAEFWGYACIPLAFFGLWKVYESAKMRYILLGGIGFAGIILSHNLTALMVTPFLLVFGILLLFLSKRKRMTFFQIASSIILGLLLSAFYWLPVPFEMQFTNVISQISGGADYHTNFVCLNQLWNSPWGYGGSIPGCIDGISFALGKVYIALLGIMIIAVPFILKKEKTKGILFFASVLGIILSLFLLLQVSEPLWNAVHILAYLQYPWRFLLLVFFFLSFAAGGIIWLIEHSTIKKKKIVEFGIVAVISVLLIAIQGKYFRPQTYRDVTSASYINDVALEWTVSTITHEYMPKGFTIPMSSRYTAMQDFVVPSGSIISQSSKTNEKKAIIQITRAATIQIKLAYFPGWHVFVDGKEVKIDTLPQGIAVRVHKGRHTLDVRYIETIPEAIGDGVSIAAIIITIIGIIIVKRPRYEEKNS